MTGEWTGYKPKDSAMKIKETYTCRRCCINCGDVTPFEVPLGQLARSFPCPNCRVTPIDMEKTNDN